MKKAVLVFALAFGFVFSAFGQNAGDFGFTVNNGQITITEYRGQARDVVIPERINGLPVVAIGEWAFADNQLTSVTIPNSVTHIGDEAFAWNKLTSVAIPNSVTYIGDYAFFRNQLTSVTIPNSVTHIGAWAFAENRLTSVSVPRAAAIADDAFDLDVTITRR